ncbi:MAG: hypothetical protein V4582_15510 [Pseudomonadota bacterium]
MFKRERAYATTHKSLPAKVYLAAGALEDDKHHDDMLRNTLALARALKARKYPDLQRQAQVIAGEEHLSVAPVSPTRGMRPLLAPRPAAPGASG